MAGNVCAAPKITLITHLCRIYPHFSGFRSYFLCLKELSCGWSLSEMPLQQQQDWSKSCPMVKERHHLRCELW